MIRTRVIGVVSDHTVNCTTNIALFLGPAIGSSVDLSAPSILPPQVRVRSTPSTPLSIYIDLYHVEKVNINKKEAGIDRLRKYIALLGIGDPS